MALESKSAPPGYINPINVRTFTQAISIDSRFRPNYFGTKSTDYDMVLPVIQKNVVSMRVSSIELPITYYAISLYNGNSTCLFIDASNTAVGWLLTLPDGNYEQSWANNSHAFSIETGMTQAIANAVPLTINANGSVQVDPSGTALTAADLIYTLDHISGKSALSEPVCSILYTDGFIVRFNVYANGNTNTGANLQMLLGWQLGFRQEEYLAKEPDGNR
jgi:hypothetical protein